MVHALEEIRRMLKPEGFLIDIHPYPEGTIVQVQQGDKILYAEPRRDSDSEDTLRTDEAVAKVVASGLYVIERSSEFDFFSIGSSAEEVQAYWDRIEPYEVGSKEEEVLAQEAELYARVDEMVESAGVGAEVAFYERAGITRLRPVG